MLLLSVTAHAAADPVISVDRLYTDSTHVKTIVRIQNTDNRAYRVIGMRCTFLYRGKGVDSAGNVATNVAAGQVVFEKLIGPPKEESVDTVQCRITYANP